MMCQRCKKRRASVRVTDVATKTEIWLCEECAQKEGVTLKSQVSLADFLAGLIKAPVTKEMTKLANLKCPECGITYLEFQSQGRFGCPNDYKVFAELVEPLLDKIHGSTKHVGKRSAGAPFPADKTASLAALRSALEAAVKAERYEEAAKLRDEIRSLKDKHSGA